MPAKDTKYLVELMPGLFAALNDDGYTKDKEQARRFDGPAGAQKEVMKAANRENYPQAKVFKWKVKANSIHDCIRLGIDDYNFRHVPAAEPTEHLPRTTAKIEVMRRRVERGEAPNHPLDIVNIKGETQAEFEESFKNGDHE